MSETASRSRGVRFSLRTEWNTEETAWSRELARRRASGLPILDMTEANPTRCGFDYDADLLRALDNADSLTYAPHPFGLRTARQSVCDYYADHSDSFGYQGAPGLSPDDVILTASTSEAYSFLFRLLCDPGDEVLIAQPSYPLFDFLAVLDDVKLIPFALFYDYGWHLDVSALKAVVTPRTRAIVIVHPNNPTGHFTSAADRRLLEEVCLTFGIALVVDEVFLDYSFSQPTASFTTGQHPVLTFVLSGLSKVAALPQMKLAWLVALGPEKEKAAALAKLEVVADTFLSVNTPVQHALPAWLGSRRSIQQQISARVKDNLEALDTRLKPADAVDRLNVEGGWYAILRAPALDQGEDVTLQLLVRSGVAIHPGSFFGMTDERHFVISLLPESSVFAEGMKEIIQFLNR